MPRVYKYTGPLDEVEIPEFGLVVKRGERVEVSGFIKHPDFEWIQPAKPKKKAPSEPAAEVAPEPVAAEENV